jgi:hypothetical protein
LSVSFFISKIIKKQNGLNISAALLLDELYLQGGLACTLPTINLPTGIKSSKLNKLKCERWWFRKLNKKINQQRELLKIAIGVVCFKNQPFSSNDAVNAYNRKLIAEKKYLSSIYFICNKTGERICVADLKSSDQRRFAEFLVTAKGIEKRAKSKGLVASLVTFTLPSEYHPNPIDEDSSNWHGFSPKEGYDKLNCITNKLNKMLHRANIYDGHSYYSIRAVEPHHDATPHFHILIFYKPECKDTIKNAIRYQFCDESFNDESKAYSWIDIDENKSSPIHYLCKHFTYTDASDKNTENIRVSANKYLWNIKNYEFTGLPRGAKSLWKELRKNKSDVNLNAIEKELRQLAINNNFNGFIALLEQPSCVITIHYDERLSRYDEKFSTIYCIKVTKIIIPIYRPILINNRDSDKLINCFSFLKIKSVKVVTNISKLTINKINWLKSFIFEEKYSDYLNKFKIMTAYLF